MYKYSKLVKENFFSDNFMAFYWLIFRKRVSQESLINDDDDEDEEKPQKAGLKKQPKVVT
jgi:hypothetical protein